MVSHRWKRFQPVISNVLRTYKASQYARHGISIRNEELVKQLKQAQSSGDGRLAVCIYRQLLMQALHVQLHWREDHGEAEHPNAVNKLRAELTRLEVVLGFDLRSAPERHFQRSFGAVKIQLAWRRKFRSFLVPLPLRRCCSRALRDLPPPPPPPVVEAGEEAAAAAAAAEATGEAAPGEAGGDATAAAAATPAAAAAAVEGEEEEEEERSRSLPWMLATIRVVYEDLITHMSASVEGDTFHHAPHTTLPQMLYRVLLDRAGTRRRADDLVRDLCKGWRVHAAASPRVALFSAFFGSSEDDDFGG